MNYQIADNSFIVKKNVKFKWTDTGEQSFRELKRQLEKTPILTIPNEEDGFVIYCDTSG